FIDVPGFCAALASAPFVDIGTPQALRQRRIGVDNMIVNDPRGGAFSGGADEDAFRAALARHHAVSGVYVERPRGVEFLSPGLFRAVVP
ncbi:TIGR02186 family protein, partial [Mycobacterium tuberculosis]|nr:TIGR02186 family protein [Mycobacterium tuberculosis]